MPGIGRFRGSFEVHIKNYFPRDWQCPTSYTRLSKCHIISAVCCVKVMLCRAPEDLLLVTFNHLDAIREMVTGADKLVAAVNDAHRQLRGVSESTRAIIHCIS